MQTPWEPLRQCARECRGQALFPMQPGPPPFPRAAQARPLPPQTPPQRSADRAATDKFARGRHPDAGRPRKPKRPAQQPPRSLTASAPVPRAADHATPKLCSFTSMRSQPKSLRALTLFSSSIKPGGLAPRPSRFQTTSRLHVRHDLSNSNEGNCSRGHYDRQTKHRSANQHVSDGCEAFPVFTASSDRSLAVASIASWLRSIRIGAEPVATAAATSTKASRNCVGSSMIRAKAIPNCRLPMSTIRKLPSARSRDISSIEKRFHPKLGTEDISIPYFMAYM